MMAIYNQANFQNAVLTFLSCVVLIIGAGCIYTFIRAIILFVFSGAKEENKKKGWNSIRFMIVGVILSLLLLLCIPVVLRSVNVPSYNYYTPKNIFVRAGDVINYLVNLGNVVKKSQDANQYQADPYYNPSPAAQQNPASTSTTDYQL